MSPLRDLPRLAICIPAHGDAVALAALLHDLRGLDYPADRLDLVVAVDGPDEELERSAREAGATTVVLEQNAGSYAARNAALDALPPDVEAVLFTDLDVRVPPGWARAHVAALRESAASGGAVRVTTAPVPSPAEWVDAGRHLRQRHFVEMLGFAATCNLAVRREVVDRLRFDAGLRSGGDFDFGLRLQEAGFTLRYAEEAWVEHPARPTARGLLKKVHRVAGGAAAHRGRGRPAVARRDPQRLSALRRAALEGVDHGWWWRLRVGALDLACSAVYAWSVPSVVLPALRRRLGVAR